MRAGAVASAQLLYYRHPPRMVRGWRHRLYDEDGRPYLDMVNNVAMPNIEVDPETYEVRADGELLTCEPATTLPMAQRYFLF